MADDQQSVPVVSSDDLVSKDLFELLGLEDMPEEQKNEIRAKTLEMIRDRTLLRVRDLLSDEEFEQYKVLLSEPESTESDKKIDEFLAGKHVDVNALTVEETILVKMQAVQAMQGLEKAYDEGK